MNTQDLKYYNNLQYLKTIIIKFSFSLFIGYIAGDKIELWVAVALSYIVASAFSFSLKLSKNYLIAIVLMLLMVIFFMFLMDQVSAGHLSKRLLDNISFLALLFPFIYDFWILISIIVYKLKALKKLK